MASQGGGLVSVLSRSPSFSRYLLELHLTVERWR
jgi:hypothetical protein